MHIEDRNAAVNYIHSVEGENVRDGTAAAHIYFSKFRKLEFNPGIIHDPANFCDILRVSIVGAGFSPGSRELVKDHSAACERGISLFVSIGIERIVSRVYIRRKHL